MSRELHRRRVVGLLLLCALFLPLACNMPAPASRPGDTESEVAWDWVEFIRKLLEGQARPAPAAPAADPMMLTVNEAIATQGAQGAFGPQFGGQSGAPALPTGFTCLEEAGAMVSYLDTFPTSPSEDTNSVVQKSFVFSLVWDPSASAGEMMSLDSGIYAGFALDWDFYARLLVPVVRTNADGSRELLSYIDREGSEVGEGDGVLFEDGLFYGEIEMRSAGKDDGKVTGARDYMYYAGGAYDPSARNMLLCLSWNEIPEGSLQEIRTVGAAGLASWCKQAGLNYFVCTASG